MTQQRKPKKSRWILWTATVLVLAVIIFTAGWYYIADRVEKGFADYQAQLASQGKALNCNEQTRTGFPIKLGLDCASLSYADPVGRLTLSTGSISTAAAIYNPRRIVSNINGPVDVTAPNLAPLSLEWAHMTITTDLSNGSNPAQLQLDVDGAGIDIYANDGGLKTALGKIKTAQFFLAPAKAENETDQQPALGDFDTKLELRQWAIEGSQRSEPLTLLLDARLNEFADYLSGQYDPIAILKHRGGSVDLTGLELRLDSGARLLVRGPARIDVSGLITADLTIDMEDPARLVGFAAEIFPPLGPMLEDAHTMLAMLPQSEGGGQNIRDLKISIKNGLVKLGLFTIGRIPPIAFE